MMFSPYERVDTSPAVEDNADRGRDLLCPHRLGPGLAGCFGVAQWPGRLTALFRSGVVYDYAVIAGV
jgi:hypothetical protein